jgi:EmrB/QacA subfamily drug resistance transporter
MTQARDDSQGLWVLVATISAASMAFIAQAALNVALPDIQEDLGAEGADLLWIVNAFQLFLGALILVGGSLGDLYGRKRIYMIGIVLFTAASILCGLAPTTETLIAARALQGLGGALMIPGSLAIISAFFDDGERGQAIGTWAAFTTMTSVAGPVLGGFLAENGLWRVIFFINVPLALLALVVLATRVPESRDEDAKDLDVIGAVIITLSLAGIVFGATEIGRAGPDEIGNPLYLGPLLGGILGVLAFFYYEGHSSHPMVNLKLFKSRTFTGANLLTLFLYGALGGALFFLPLNLVQVQGYSATLAGLANLPFSILLIAMSRWAGGLVDRIGPRPPLIYGPLIVGAGFLALALPGITAGPSDYWTTFFPGSVLFGFGMGIVVSPLTTSVMGSVPQRNSGIASGINNTMSRAAGVLAVAILGGIALLFFSGLVADQTDGYSLNAQEEAVLETQIGELANASASIEVFFARSVFLQQEIDRAFVATFRLMMIIAAGMCFLSSALAAVFVQKRLEPPEELKADPA